MVTNNTINNRTGALTVNGAYSLPTADGTTGYVLTTNGAGTVSWQPSSGESGSVVQVQTSFSGTELNTNAVIPLDNSIPQNTEGTALISVSITPQSAANNLLVTFICNCSTQGAAVAALFRDSTANAISASGTVPKESIVGADWLSCITLNSLVNAGSTASTTFSIRIGPSYNTPLSVNGITGINPIFGGVACTSLVVMEIEA